MEILTGVQRDIDTGNWFFLVYDQSGAVEFESDAIYHDEEDAEQGAQQWILENRFIG